MVYEGRKDDAFLYAQLLGRRPKATLIPLLKNAYDEVDRLRGLYSSHFFIFFFFFFDRFQS